jgi:hypothetical protein
VIHASSFGEHLSLKRSPPYIYLNAGELWREKRRGQAGLIDNYEGNADNPLGENIMFIE